MLDGAKGLQASMDALHRHSDVFFSESFLAPRPLLQALREPDGCVLLIDEVDKADHEFEAFLLEVLSEFQISIPELGTIRAQRKPFVFLTSNNTRDMSDALKRRCLHLYIPFPEAALERSIIQVRVPDIPAKLRAQLVDFVQQIRKLDLKKQPSVSETIDWARVLLLLHASALDAALVRETLNIFLKFEEDIATVDEHLHEFLHKAEMSSVAVV